MVKFHRACLAGAGYQQKYQVMSLPVTGSPRVKPSRAQLHGSAYHIKQKIDAYGSREFRAYVKHISQVRRELLRVRKCVLHGPIS